MDQQSQEKLSGQRCHSLSLAVLDHEVIENSCRENKVDCQEERDDGRVAVEPSVEAGERTECAYQPNTKDVCLEQASISERTTVMGHEGVVGDAQEEGEGTVEEICYDKEQYHAFVG